MGRIGAALLLVMLLTFGCRVASPPPRVPANPLVFFEDKDEMADELAKYISPGTPIEDARAFMQSAGFHVTEKQADDGRLFLYCDCTRSEGWVDRRWQILIDHDTRHVSEITVNFGYIGP